MLEILIVVVSILFQIAAVVLALRLIRVTERRTAWLLIAIAILLMAIRRLITLIHLASGFTHPLDFVSESIALITSVLILLGVALIAPLFLSVIQANKALRESEERFRQVAESAEEFIWEVDVDGLYTYASPGVKKILGYKPEEIVGKKHFYDLFVPNERDFLKKAAFAVFAEKNNFRDFINPNVHKNGAMIFLETSGSPILDKRGNLLGYRGVDTDVTERKMTEEILKKAHDELEEKVVQRTIELRDTNKQLNQEILERKKIENEIRLRNAIVKLSTKVSSRKEYLNAVAKLIRGLSDCQCVGIRLLNEEGEIPYESYIGFSREFWESENWLSVVKDECACIRVIKGMPQPQDIQAMTKAGSFRSNNTIEFMAKLSEQEKAEFRGVCAESGFTSVAVMPVRYKNKIIGAVHLADKREGKVPLELVEFIESLTFLIGEGIHQLNMEDRIRQSYVTQSVVNSLLRLSLRDINIEEILSRALDMLLSISWFAFESTGSIFLVEEEPDALVLKAQKGLPEYLQKECSRISFGRCLCGQAALERKIQFADHVNDAHEIIYRDIAPHGHYCVPILFGDKILGVLNIYLKEGYHRDQRKEEFLTTIANALAGIIQRRQIENKLNETNELLERVFSSTHFLIAYLDTSFNFIRVNQAYAKAGGHPADFYTGKNHFDLHPDEENKSIFRKVVETGEAHSVFAKPFVYPKDPKRRVTYWDWSLQPVKNLLGRVEGLVFCLVDVTKRKQAETELLKTQKELNDARRLSDIGILAATVAHELRNPLGVIRTASYNIKRKAQNPLLESHLNNIEKKILESEQIINNLLFYSQIKMPHYESTAIYDILEECVAAAKNKFGESKAAVHKKYKDIKNNLIEADPLQIREVFNNMLNNAYESFAEKKGEIEITATCDEKKNQMSIGFKDNGAGIEPEDIERLSSPFFTTKSQGTGLGLTVCYQIVNLHGGKIDIESRKAKGTSFTVTLPVKREG